MLSHCRGVDLFSKAAGDRAGVNRSKLLEADFGPM